MLDGKDGKGRQRKITQLWHCVCCDLPVFPYMYTCIDVDGGRHLFINVTETRILQPVDHMMESTGLDSKDWQNVFLLSKLQDRLWGPSAPYSKCTGNSLCEINHQNPSSGEIRNFGI
jgi:hypothetical protein